MKKIAITVINLFFLCSALLGQSEIKTGDLLFVGIPLDYSLNESDMSSAISKSTGKKDEINYIHVAILEVDSLNNIWVIDATIKRGVDRHPIDTFLNDFTLKNGNLPILDVKRLKNNKSATLFVDNAKKYCGKGYDLYFMPDNNLYYCSELVRDSYITQKGKHIFNSYPMNFKSDDGTFPEYWRQLFEKLGQPIPQGVDGTNPNSMAKEKCLKQIGSIR